MDDKILQALRFAHESEAMRQERTIKRLWIVILVLIVLLVGTNFAWLIYESGFEDTQMVQIEQEVDTGAGDAYVAGGDINYGEGQTKDNDNQDPVEGEEN